MLMEIFGEVSRFDFESVGFDDEDNEISGFDEVGLGEAEISCKKLLYALIWSSFSLLCQLVWKGTQLADVLKAKGKGADGSWLWCTTDDSVYDDVKSMTQHNVYALVVVKPGEKNSNA
ncbi:hypothetical protein LWI29_006526 [Acer saccharum]|uniref:Uncharacterized protein n=1 Tax=Acer saccharum TaxID=4024 RepID=A0AA39RP12_ACESA|nr:hypothetical protein LWI29_006526 [Acer saccharum]